MTHREKVWFSVGLILGSIIGSLELALLLKFGG